MQPVAFQANTEYFEPLHSIPIEYHKSQCWHSHSLVIKLRMFQIISHCKNVFSLFVSMESIKLNKSALPPGWLHWRTLLVGYLMSRMKILLWSFQLLLISLLNGKESAIHCMKLFKVTLTEWNISKRLNWERFFHTVPEWQNIWLARMPPPGARRGLHCFLKLVDSAWVKHFLWTSKI